MVLHFTQYPVGGREGVSDCRFLKTGGEMRNIEMLFRDSLDNMTARTDRSRVISLQNCCIPFVYRLLRQSVLSGSPFCLLEFVVCDADTFSRDEVMLAEDCSKDLRTGDTYIGLLLLETRGI